MYEGDIFFLLATDGHLALALLSGILVFVSVAAVRLARRHIGMTAAAPAAGLVIWWLFLWLTPQLYYFLYMGLLDGLPFRIVLGWPPGPDRMVELLAFRGSASLADHALGALGWGMLAISVPKG